MGGVMTQLHGETLSCRILKGFNHQAQGCSRSELPWVNRQDTAGNSERVVSTSL